jgi:hypothetical protein
LDTLIDDGFLGGGVHRIVQAPVSLQGAHQQVIHLVSSNEREIAVGTHAHNELRIEDLGSKSVWQQGHGQGVHRQGF